MNVVPITKPQPFNDVTATLRRIADEIDASEHGDWPVTTCVVVIGHSDSETPRGDDEVAHRYYWQSYGIGPRHDSFTCKGLLMTAMHQWGSDFGG
jgi:hypothetical protein